MLVGDYPPTVQECVWTNLPEKHRSWKDVDFISFCENGIAQGRNLPSLPMHGDKETAKRKAESGRRAVKTPEKTSDQLVKTICDKKGVSSN